MNSDDENEYDNDEGGDILFCFYNISNGIKVIFLSMHDFIKRKFLHNSLIKFIHLFFLLSVLFHYFSLLFWNVGGWRRDRRASSYEDSRDPRKRRHDEPVIYETNDGKGGTGRGGVRDYRTGSDRAYTGVSGGVNEPEKYQRVSDLNNRDAERDRGSSSGGPRFGEGPGALC